MSEYTCQSCGLGIDDESMLGTYPDGRKNTDYCIHCFRDGEFAHPGITMEEQIDLNLSGDNLENFNRSEDTSFSLEGARKVMNLYFPSLKRWMPVVSKASWILERTGYGVLSTIIENGIDVPNANTIIINQAQNFGLSDLHQLRGRVGRSNVKAFCYLIVPPMVSITDDARRRLRAIEAFSDLGSGFNIAMQDLDIRGAGNLLGGEQSGFVADMGFETYQRILSEAFMEIREEEEDTLPDDALQSDRYLTDCVIDTDLELLIPDSYISQVSEKIRLYKELDAMSGEDEISDFIAGLRDRFGELPEQLVQLINVVRLKREAIALGFERIVIKNGIMLAYFISNQSSDYYKSVLFSDILNYINGRKADFRIKEQNDRLFLRVEGVETMGKAYNLLLKMRETVGKIS